MAILGTVHVDCHFPKMDFFKTCGSLEFSSSHVLLGAMSAQQRWWAQPGTGEGSPPRVPLCSSAGADVLRAETKLGGPFGDVNGVGGSHPLLFTRRGTENLLLNSPAL